MSEDYNAMFPAAAHVIRDCFYVYVLMGPQSVEEAVQIRQELNQLLKQGCMTLKMES